MTKEEFAYRAEEMRVSLYRVACAYLRQEADRMDAVQEALLKAWYGLPHLKDESYFKTWLTRILIRECVNIQRKQHRTVPMEIIPEKPEKESGGIPEVREALLRLPENQRIVVVLFYMEEYPVEEIARTLRLPKGTVCSRLKRAREKLKAYIEEEAEI